MELAGENKNYAIQILESQIEDLRETINSDEQKMAGWERSINLTTQRVEDMKRFLSECIQALETIHRISGK